MHEVMKVGYRDALVASEARVEALEGRVLHAETFDSEVSTSAYETWEVEAGVGRAWDSLTPEQQRAWTDAALGTATGPDFANWEKDYRRKSSRPNVPPPSQRRLPMAAPSIPKATDAKTVLEKYRGDAARLRKFLSYAGKAEGAEAMALECWDALDTSEARVEALAAGFARVLDRSLRIMDGRVDCTAYSHADYMVQIANALPDAAKAPVALARKEMP
jgi:hypothetical protein